ncbi:LysR family transcriptional regulator [Roseateles cellulosilyticus]|uniref:LysR family transcriptional regulator n=1 Tax=Pelomonas cellulosilytica TaxID=2906762 RepID=A0ABS8XZ99_9BURK|nr:LysR family transcriptional regulator [Pelomonas sp. P8]MCE4556600.1 LysR family transcriptional regulator [Pelomonas sp. P8]
MHFNKLDLNLLVALDALLTERSISRAAERLHMSQPAMSNALARLRSYFDDPLLVQVGRKMEATPRAEALREAARDVLVRVDATITAQPRFDATQSDREFNLLVSDFTLSVIGQHLVALASRQSAKVRFRFHSQVDNPQRALERGEADMLVIPSGYCSPDHPTETLFEEEFSCVVWRESRLARQGSLSFDDYTAAGHVVVQPPGGMTFESWFMQRYGVSRRIDVTSFSFATAPSLVVGTERIATVHSRLARLAASQLPLVLLEPPMPMPRMVQAIQWHKYRTQDPGLLWLRHLLRDAAAEMDALSAR